MDSYLEVRLSGRVFPAAVDSLDEVVIDQDISGSRLFGKVRNTVLYLSIFNDPQTKKLSSIAPIDVQCLFNAGFYDSTGYRIPSLITLEFRVVVADADQRETTANDSSNSIDFMVRRSFDGGHAWGGLQTVLTHPGHGARGASVIDSRVVRDHRNGRLVILINHFLGGTGQPNIETDLGVDERGRYILHDANGVTYTWNQDGSVTDTDGNIIALTALERGNATITEGGQEPSGDSVSLADDVDPHQTLLTARIRFFQIAYSDGDGKT